MVDVKDLAQRCDNVLPGHGPRLSIAARLRELAGYEGAEADPDYYGEGVLLSGFEAELAELFGFEAAVFMPSGTMAQQIALRLWCERSGRATVAMHPTSHLETAEQLGYQHLHGLKRLPFGAPELLSNRLLTLTDFEQLPAEPGAVLLELPCRPLGGVLPAWDELQAISSWCRDRGVPLHMDGARVWQTTSFYQRSLAEIAGLFDSVYVSFYKDLGGLAGCMLLGPAEFIASARMWQQRHGGRLFDQSPYVVAAKQGLEARLPQLPAWVERARELASQFNEHPRVRVNPDPPHVNLFQLFLAGEPETLLDRHHTLAAETGTFLVSSLQRAQVPGWSQAEVHCWENAMAFDLARLPAFLDALLPA